MKPAMTEQPPRPDPIGTNAHGIVIYSGETVAIYRMLNAVKVKAVASRLSCAGSLILYYEAGQPELQETQAIQFMNTIDTCVRDRERLIAKGKALQFDLNARGKRGTPPPPTGRNRTEAEAEAILKAQDRGGEG